jgi:hypothetical protein
MLEWGVRWDRTKVPLFMFGGARICVPEGPLLTFWFSVLCRLSWNMACGGASPKVTRIGGEASPRCESLKSSPWKSYQRRNYPNEAGIRN